MKTKLLERKEMYSFTRESVLKALAQSTSAEIREIACPCGCGDLTMIAVDETAVWVTSTVSLVRDCIRCVGLENLEEAQHFVNTLRNAAEDSKSLEQRPKTCQCERSGMKKIVDEVATAIFEGIVRVIG